jgi:two-component system, NarL family, sensor kinase
LNQHFDIKILDLFLIIVSGTIVLTATAILFIFLLLRSRKNKELYHQEKQLLQSQHTQALLQTQLEIQEQTLATISQEIHDNIGQVLSLAKLNLNTLSLDSAGKPKLDSTVQLVSKAISDLRDLSRSMHGDRIAELGLNEAITAEMKILQNTGQFATGMQITGSMYRLEQQQEMVLFRMVQEALHNAIKHSNADTISTTIHYQPHLLTLTVSDDGKGFSAEALQATQKGIGLKSMQNRAALIGAVFNIASPAGGGTAITIKLDTAGKNAIS